MTFYFFCGVSNQECAPPRLRPTMSSHTKVAQKPRLLRSSRCCQGAVGALHGNHACAQIWLLAILLARSLKRIHKSRIYICIYCVILKELPNSKTK